MVAMTFWALLGTITWMLPTWWVARLNRAKGCTQVLWILSAMLFSYLVLVPYLARPNDHQPAQLRWRP